MAVKAGQLDLSGWPLLNVVLESRTGPPENPRPGQVYFDLVLGQYHYWRDPEWHPLLSQADVDAAIAQIRQELTTTVEATVGTLSGPSPVLIFENGLV